MKRGLIVTGGRLEPEFAASFLKNKNYDLVIAVDAGLRHTEMLGIHPDVVVGDFDTLGKERLLAYQKDSSLQWEIHKPEKDETDTELAFSTAFSRGVGELAVLGATGGRLDHELANIHLLAQCLKNGVDAAIYDEKNKIYLLDAKLHGGKSFLREQVYGKYVSFLPLTERVLGITLRGFKYPLTERDISVFENPSLCVSNEVAEETARMTFRQGTLICIESHD